jgi:hypothetical protein
MCHELAVNVGRYSRTRSGIAAFQSAKIELEVATSAQKVEFGPMGPGASRRLHGPSQSDREAAEYVKRLLEQRAKRIEAQTRQYQADLLAWQKETRNVEPLRKR